MPKRKAVKAPKAESLLIELLTEELPPKSLKRLSEAFAKGVVAGLREQHFIGADAEVESFATPRRLAVRVSDVLAQADRVIEHKGPSVQTGLDADGKPTPALLGFSRSRGVDVEKLERRKVEELMGATLVPDRSGGFTSNRPTINVEYFVYRSTQKGEPLANCLAGVVDASLKKLPVAKLMRWGSGEAQFVRPVHGLILMHGDKVIPGTVLGIKSGNKTLGHRFLSKGMVTIKRADDYEKALEKQGEVVPSVEKRREGIVHELDRAVAKLKAKGTTWHLGKGKELDVVDEVAGIVESPHVYVGEFDSAFLDLPRECLILSMQQHQKYFPLEASNGRLLPQFLFVSNMRPTDARHIIHGNERVLRARLADARFFFDQDRKTKLEDRVERLKNVVYHNKLGSQYDRVLRIQKLAVEIARKVGAAVEWVGRAAYLSKADLLTEMVGEFPELQGIMGNYYAYHDHEDPHVATAILEHYLPRHAGDELPLSQESLSLALADKLDTLVGIYGIGLIPTGEKDPFGLRRHALGIVRILVERKNLPSLDILELLQLARECFSASPIAEDVAHNLHTFILERLKPYLREKPYAPDEIDAVLALNPTRLDEVLPRIEAIKKFRALPEGMALSASNKRIRNILRQAGGKIDGTVKSDLLTEEAEKKLAQVVGSASYDLEPMIARHDYSAALKRLASLRPTVDEFFDKVMVMADDSAVRANRLALLNNLSNLFLHVADVSRLQG